MKWLVKAATQKVLSYLPSSQSLNFFFQRHISKTLPVGLRQFEEKAAQAVEHLALVQAFLPSCKLSELSLYEFGAGWDLTIPLIYYALGVERQTLVDIRPGLRVELINEGLRKLSTNRVRLEELLKRPLRTTPTTEVRSIKDLESRFGISYLAPCDAAETGLASNSFDLVTSTHTLEHIPKESIRRILLECRRLLKNGGLMSSLIDMRDHYAYFDRSVSDYNYLKFSNDAWSWINSPLHYQNRLRLSDYLKLVEDSGMEIAFQRSHNPSESDLVTLRSLKLASHFQHAYSVQDLAAKRAHILSLNRTQ